MSTETRGNLTIIRHDQTDGMISVYRGDIHLGAILPLLLYETVPTDPSRATARHPDEASAIAYLAADQATMRADMEQAKKMLTDIAYKPAQS